MAKVWGESWRRSRRESWGRGRRGWFRAGGFDHCDPLIDHGRRFDHGHSSPATEDSQVGVEQVAFVLLRILRVNCLRDQIVARQGREAVDQERGFHQALQVDIDGIGKAFAVRIYDQHLAGVKENRFADVIIAKNPPRSLQDDKLDESIRVVLEHHSGASDRGRDGRGIDLRAARIFRHSQKHDAAAELQIAGAFVETENRIRAEPGESLVGKGKFGTGLDTGANSGAVAHFIAHRRRPRRGLRGDELDAPDHLTDARLLELGGVQCAGWQHQKREQRTLAHGGGGKPKWSTAVPGFLFMRVVFLHLESC